MLHKHVFHSCQLHAPFLVLLAVAAVPAGAQEVTRGPYLQMATPESVVVVWRTNEAIEPVVKIGPSPEGLTKPFGSEDATVRLSVDVAADYPAPYGAVPLLYDEPQATTALRRPGERTPSTPGKTWQYEVSVTGLQPGKQYYYGVYDGAKLIAGGDHDHFLKASPPAGSPSKHRLWVVGDSGTGGKDQRQVFEGLRAFEASSGRQVDAYLHVGDMAYGDGADIEFQRNFFEVYHPLLRNTVCWPTMGNHEGHTSRGISQFGPYYDAYVVPTKAEAGGVASGTEAYYSFVIGRTHFVCLDSHDLDRSPAAAMGQWLQADLEEADADWLIAFWHHPPYTKGSHDSDYERQLIEMREYFMPLLESGGVDLVLSGHSHIYERSMLIDGAYATPTVAEGVILDDGDGSPEGDGPYRKSAGLPPRNGTVAVVAGHGGAGISRKGTMPIMREIIVEHGSLILDIDGDTLTGTMINKQGATRDRFQVVKRGNVTHKPVKDPWQPVHDESLITEKRLMWSKDQIGKFPPQWTLVEGKEEHVRIENRPGTPYQQAALRSGEGPLFITYDEFDAGLSELEAYVEFSDSDAPGAAGLVLGCASDGSYYAFLLDPAEGKAQWLRVESGGAHLVAERAVDVAFNSPVKVELEPGEGLLEVQINDSLEYTVPLEDGLPSGRVGVLLRDNAALKFAGMTIERSP